MKLMAVRLPDDVAAAVEEEAKKQERSKSQVVVRALRQVLAITQPGKLESLASMQNRAQDRAVEKILEKPRFRKCQHRGNEYTCERIACKIKTGRG